MCVFVVGVCVFVVGMCVLWSVRVYVCGPGRCVYVCLGRVLVVGNASLIDLLLYEVGNEE